MFDNYYVDKKERASGALEIALQIHDQEKKQALLAGQYQNAKPFRSQRKTGFLKGLLTVLFAS
jgi:hypothetical protein